MLPKRKRTGVLFKPQSSEIKLTSSILSDRRLLIMTIGMSSAVIVSGLIISSGYIAQIKWVTPRGNNLEFQLKPSR
jgi:hypothetical protein